MVTVLLVGLTTGVAAKPVGPNGELDFYDKVWIGLTGKNALAELSGYRYEKKVGACVGSCTTSGWVSASTYRAKTTDVGGFFDTAYTYYDYR